jgi:hypothetical protein
MCSPTTVGCATLQTPSFSIFRTLILHSKETEKMIGAFYLKTAGDRDYDDNRSVLNND